MKRFWLVWNHNGGVPTVQHETAQSAKTEAERLARNNPGQQFHVLEWTGTAIKRDVDWIECEFEPPF